MRIGILTFHWATNYGAILQAWCLQEFLLEQGHEVDIINYKPSCYDFSWLRILKHPNQLWKSNRILINKKKESLLDSFRREKLRLTTRMCSINDLGNKLDKYDVLISGSDQVLNPSFTLHGEGGKPSQAYWLGIGGGKTLRIGYAVSFGHEDYPMEAARFAKKWVNGFNAIGTRESTGQRVLESLGYIGKTCVVPDPTILLGTSLFAKLGVSFNMKNNNYTCVYMLRREVKLDGNVIYLDETHKPLPMEQWLSTISNASKMITNSYHGTLMAIFAHVPFAVLLETGKGSGMNDRFFTMLNQLSCINRVASTVEEALAILKRPIDFTQLDLAVNKYRNIGVSFLKENNL